MSFSIIVVSCKQLIKLQHICIYLLGTEQQSNQNSTDHDGSNNELEKEVPNRNETSGTIIWHFFFTFLSRKLLIVAYIL